jgi:hypothetical protein
VSPGYIVVDIAHGRSRLLTNDVSSYAADGRLTENIPEEEAGDEEMVVET